MSGLQLTSMGKFMISRIFDPAIEAIVAQTAAAGCAVTGGPLETFHERYSAEKAQELKAAVIPFVKQILNHVTQDEDCVQVMPNLRVHRPGQNTAIPFHSDTLYGHSHEEINYWLALTRTEGTNSLWMVGGALTAELHELLKSGMPLEEFNLLAKSKAAPIETPAPGLFTFCCSQIHGSVLNTTPFTRVSMDFRVLPHGAKANIKKNGYFRPKWLPDFPCPVALGKPVTTIASLDLPVPAHFQRMQMQKFYPQHGHSELVEFHNMKHAPTLEFAMQKGPAIAYSIVQIKKPMTLDYPIGFADENVWFTPETQWAFDRMLESR